MSTSEAEIYSRAQTMLNITDENYQVLRRLALVLYFQKSYNVNIDT